MTNKLYENPDAETRRLHGTLNAALAAMDAGNEHRTNRYVGEACHIVYGEFAAAAGYRAYRHDVDECDLLSELGEIAVKLVWGMLDGTVARPRCLGAFCRSVVQRTAVTLHRKNVVQRKFADLLIAEAELNGHAVTSFESDIVAIDLYHRYVASLPLEDRMVAGLPALGYSDDEIGRLVGLKPNAVGVRRFRIRARLKAVMGL